MHGFSSSQNRCCQTILGQEEEIGIEKLKISRQKLFIKFI
jgi:hypothetical protein